jgi:DNA-binding transcriptional LysR family regulator
MSFAERTDLFMTGKQIQYFMEVYRTRNISSAANNLFVSRPVISRSLHDLEEMLGIQLFKRGLSGIIPTSAGDTVYRMFDEFSRVFEFTLSQIKYSAEEKSSMRIKIGIANGCGNWFYPLVHKQLLKECPDVHVTVNGIPSESASALILDGIFDAAIAPVMHDTVFPLDFVYLYSAQWVLCTPQKQPYLEMSAIRIEDCKTLPLAMLESLPPAFYEYTNAVLATREPDMVRIAVSSGIACAILPYELCGAWDDVWILPFSPPKLPPIHLFWNKCIPHSSSFDRFIETMRNKDYEELRRTNGLYIAANHDRIFADCGNC